MPVTWAADGTAGTFPAQTAHSGQVHRPCHVPRLRRACRGPKPPNSARHGRGSGAGLWLRQRDRSCGAVAPGGAGKGAASLSLPGTARPLSPDRQDFPAWQAVGQPFSAPGQGAGSSSAQCARRHHPPAPIQTILPGRADAGRRRGFRPRPGVLRVKPGRYCRRNPLSGRRLRATPVVCRSAMPTRPFRVRLVWKAVSPPSGRQPRLPVSAAPEVMAGSRRIFRINPSWGLRSNAGAIRFQPNPYFRRRCSSSLGMISTKLQGLWR